MKKNMILFLIMIILLCFSVESFSQEKNQPKNTDNSWVDIIYGKFKEIEYFNFIHVHIEGEDGEKIGLNEEALTKYAKLKFKNNFAYINYKNIAPHDISDSEEKKCGSLWFRFGYWEMTIR